VSATTAAPPARHRTRPDFVTGNTRLRARIPALTPPDRLERWQSFDLDALDTQLRGTPFARHMDRETVDQRHALLMAVERGTREVLRATATAYSGAARVALLTLLSPYDSADLVTLVRAAARGLTAEDVAPLLHAVGAVTPVLVREVLADDPAVTIARLAARRLPDPAVARHLLAGADAFARTGDLGEWEYRVAASVAAQADAALTPLGAGAGPIRRHLAAGRDVTNLLAALRARSEGATGSGAGRTGGTGRAAAAARPGPGDLPAGGIDHQALAAIAAGADLLDRVPLSWRPLVATVLGGGPPQHPPSLDTLSRELHAQRLRSAADRLRGGDPLGADVPVAYLARVELQALALGRAIELATPSTPHAAATLQTTATVPAPSTVQVPPDVADGRR
jgi:hypothetical protein